MPPTVTAKRQRDHELGRGDATFARDLQHRRQQDRARRDIVHEQGNRRARRHDQGDQFGFGTAPIGLQLPRHPLHDARPLQPARDDEQADNGDDD